MLAGLLLAVEGLVRKGRVAPEQVNQVLVLEYRLPLGNLVHMTPVFEAIKRSRPEVEVTVATLGLGLQVLRHSPFVDHLIETPDPTKNLAAAVRALRKSLKRLGIRPDCVLTGVADQRTRIALTAMLGSGGWRGGYTLKPALYYRPLAHDGGLSLIRNNLRVAKLIGCDAEITQPQVFFSKRDAVTAETLLRDANPEGRPLAVMVTHHSGTQPKAWHTERFVEVIRNVVLERGFSVVYVGTASDAEAIGAIRDCAGGLGRSIAGKTSVSELAAVLALSDVVVTIDTGSMHIGRAVGVPMVVLGPSWDKTLEWMPLGVENVRIRRGEDRIHVPAGYQLDEISVDSVLAAFSELTTLYPPSAEARQSRLQAGMSEVDHMMIR